MEIAEFRMDKIEPKELEKILHQHKNNSMVAVVNAKNKHIAVYSAYTSYQNNGDAILFYHDNPDSSKKELFSLKKGELCCIGPMEKVNLKMEEYRNSWLSRP